MTGLFVVMQLIWNFNLEVKGHCIVVQLEHKKLSALCDVVPLFSDPLSFNHNNKTDIYICMYLPLQKDIYISNIYELSLTQGCSERPNHNSRTLTHWPVSESLGPLVILKLQYYAAWQSTYKNKADVNKE